MTQSGSSDSLTLVQSTSVESDPSTLVEVYADGLMNDLFDDVERILDGEAASLPVQEPSAPQGLDMAYADLTAAAGLMPIGGSLTSLNPAEPQETPSDVPVKANGHWLVRVFDRLLLGAAGASLICTAALWWVSYQRQINTPVAVPQPPTAEQVQADADGQFLQYLQRALDVIDDDTAEAPTATNPTGNLSTVALGGSPIPPPSTMLPSGLSTAPNTNLPGNINVIERVYIPVYQPAPYAAAAPAASNLPPATTAAPTGTAPVPNIAPTAVHVLVGVLELGDRSAALFEVNGLAQRIYIGEPIASSGWTLVSITNQEAIIRRNGEVRSVYVGQQF